MSSRTKFVLGFVVAVVGWYATTPCLANPIHHYYVLAIANDGEVDNNDKFVKALKRFAPYAKLGVYKGGANEDKSSPVWILDNKDGDGISQALRSFKAEHSIGSRDVFLFYYSGHSTRIADDDGDEKEPGSDPTWDEALFKEDSTSCLRDDDLASRIKDIGATNDDFGSETLRLAILDTCLAKGFWNGKHDLKSVPGCAAMFASEEDEVAHTANCVTTIDMKVNRILAHIDKGLTDEQNGGYPWTEGADNGVVPWMEWWHWIVENNATHETPAWAGGSMYEKTWRRPVLPEPASLVLLGLGGLVALRRRRVQHV